MPYSTVQYTGTGAQTLFAVPYPFISRAHVSVRVGVVSTAFTWINDGQISISPAPANGAVVTVERNSSRTTRIVDFQDGTQLTEADLDTANLQALYVAQEAFDASDLASVSSQVAADLASIQAAYVATLNSEANAANSAAAALLSQTEASISAASCFSYEAAAAVSASAAAASAVTAAGYATTAVLKANNLSDVANRQTSLNTLTAVSAATNEYVLTKDTASGNAIWKAVAGVGDMLKADNLSGLANAATARTNLGLGSAATTASTAYATSTQGTTADNALPKAGGTMTGDLTLQSNIVFSGSSRRITGDLSGSGATFPMFKTSTVNGSSVVQVAPDGTSQQSWAYFYGNSDVANAALMRFGITNTGAFFDTTKVGTGTVRDLVLSAQGVSSLIITGTTGDIATGRPLTLGDKMSAQYTIDFNAVVDDGTSGTSKTINFTSGQYHKLSMTGNCTFTFTAPPGPCVVQLELTQDGTGSRTMTLPAGTNGVKWPAAYAAGDKLLTTTASARDLLILRWNGTDYLANLIKGIA